jgi:RNA recognition motif-containing protein
MKIDRFTFHNDSRCYIELASEEEARKAIELLHDTEFMHRTIRVTPVKEDFVWGTEGKREDGRRSRFLIANARGPSEALKPLFEGRRMMFSVQPPGWTAEDSSISLNKFGASVIEEHLGKYGIEAIGSLQPFFGDKGSHPRMLCLMDFTTKSGADQAVQAVHETDIKGRKVWLRPSVQAPWRAHQVGKVDAGLLAELQAKGLASTEPYEDNFVNSDQRKGTKNYKTTRIQRVERKKAEQKKEANASKKAD